MTSPSVAAGNGSEPHKDYDEMSDDQRQREIYNAVLEMKQEFPEFKGRLMRMDANLIEARAVQRIHGESIEAVKAGQKDHEAKDDARHAEILTKLATERASRREIRGKLDSVSEEIEDTKTRDLRELRRRAEAPGKALKRAGWIVAAVVLVTAAHFAINAVTGAVGSKPAPAEQAK